MVSTLVQERLTVWGALIRQQRVARRIKVKDLAARIGITIPTLARLERGDPGTGVGSYLSAFAALGVLDIAVPVPALALWQQAGMKRVRDTAAERTRDYF